LALKDVTADMQPRTAGTRNAATIQPYSVVTQMGRNGITRRLMEYGGIGAIMATRIVSEIADTFSASLFGMRVSVSHHICFHHSPISSNRWAYALK